MKLVIRTVKDTEAVRKAYGEAFATCKVAELVDGVDIGVTKTADSFETLGWIVLDLEEAEKRGHQIDDNFLLADTSTAEGLETAEKLMTHFESISRVSKEGYELRVLVPKRASKAQKEFALESVEETVGETT